MPRWLRGCSTSSSITAAAVLQLAEREVVALDAPAERYIDGFPYGSAVTIRQLLAHTSGIANPIPLRWVHPAAAHAAFDERAALTAVLARYPRLASRPGRKYRYSNIGYWLLGRVVESASGEQFQAYVTRHVLQALGIEPAALGYGVARPGDLAMGYLEKFSLMNLVKGLFIDRALVGATQSNWVEIRSHYLNGPAFGGLVGSARGFAAFLQDQLRPSSAVLGDAGRRFFYEPQFTARGSAVPMTLGWHIGSLAGTRHFYKEGGGGGFRSMMRLYPAKGIGTVVLVNATGFDVRGLLDTIDPAFFGS